MENNKKGNGLVILLIVLLLVFASVSVLFITGVIKSPFVKETTNVETSNKTTITTESETTNSETVNNSSTNEQTTKVVTKSSDERYKEFITNLASSIKKNYINDHKQIEGSYETSDIYNSERMRGGANNNGYTVAVKNNLELIYSYQTTDERHIADNVVSFFDVYVGNGGYKTLYFITTDGVLHSVNLELHLFENEELKIADLDYKNIVEIKTGATTSASVPIFIDIDGNVIFRKN